MNTKWIGALLVSAAGLGFVQAAVAAETGFYVGGFYGKADKDEAQSSFDATAAFVNDQLAYVPTSGSSTFDKKTNGYGFFGGYRLFEHLALEGGYMDLGTVTYRGRSTGTVSFIDPISGDAQQGPTDALVNIDSHVGGIAVSALGILPISYNAEIYGRGGVLFSSHRFDVFYQDVIGPLRDRSSESDIDFMVGAGASYLLAEVYTLRAEFIRVFDAGKKVFGVGEGDVDMITVGITVRF
jgi:OOP family OmpA-OmpF porin